MRRSIRHFMTSSPYTIGQEQSLEKAHQMMRDHGIRHLPVLAAGKLIGLVSQRDLHMIETLRDVDQQNTTVGEAMSQDVYCVDPSASLFQVAREMAEHKYGSVVVCDRGRVVGVFTTTDALQALAGFEMLDAADGMTGHRTNS
jgi:acetoin utilization protein AcuB